jgi:hypothetical protein
MNDKLWALLQAAIVGTVGYVWVVLAPGLSAVQADQVSIKDHIIYIRERVDELYKIQIHRKADKSSRSGDG